MTNRLTYIINELFFYYKRGINKASKNLTDAQKTSIANKEVDIVINKRIINARKLKDMSSVNKRLYHDIANLCVYLDVDSKSKTEKKNAIFKLMKVVYNYVTCDDTFMSDVIFDTELTKIKELYLNNDDINCYKHSCSLYYNADIMYKRIMSNVEHYLNDSINKPESIYFYIVVNNVGQIYVRINKVFYCSNNMFYYVCIPINMVLKN